MAFSHEKDDLPIELRRSSAKTVSLWAKVDGANVSVTGTPTFVVYDSSGAEVQASTNATATTVNSVTRIDCAVSAISTLGERYRLEVEFVYSSVTHLMVRLFDVVLYPFSEIDSVSLNDMQEIRPDVDLVLARFASRLGLADAAAAAAVFSVRARLDLDALIREQVQKDAAERAPRYDASPRMSVSRYARPYAVLSRERLRRPETLIALKLVYLADSKDPEEGGDSSGKLYQEFSKLADQAWRSVGPLEYAEDSLTPRDTLAGSTRLVFTRRRQA